MKGKSLRWILILGLVVCAQLAVASNAFAISAWYWGGTLLGERTTLSASPYTGNVASSHEIVIFADYTPAGNGLFWQAADKYSGLFVQRVPNYAGIAQTIRTVWWLQRYNGRSWDSVASQTQNLATVPSNEIGGSWYNFRLPSFTFPTGYYYRLRVSIEWYQTYGWTRLGWKWIGFGQDNYYCNFLGSPAYPWVGQITRWQDNYGEGAVCYPNLQYTGGVTNGVTTLVVLPPPQH